MNATLGHSYQNNADDRVFPNEAGQAAEGMLMSDPVGHAAVRRDGLDSSRSLAANSLQRRSDKSMTSCLPGDCCGKVIFLIQGIFPSTLLLAVSS